MTTATIVQKSPQSHPKAPSTHKAGSQTALQLDNKAKKSLQAGRKNLSKDKHYVEAFSFIDNLLAPQ